MLTSLTSRFLRAATTSVRWPQGGLDGRVDVDRRRLKRTASVGSIRAVQKSGPELGLKTSARKRVLGAVDGGLGENHRFLAGRHFGLGLDDVERRHGADLDARAVVLERLLRQLERLALHVEVADGVHQVVVRVANVADGAVDRLLQLHVGDFLVLLADEQLLARAVDLEVAQQRLRVDRPGCSTSAADRSW